MQQLCSREMHKGNQDGAQQLELNATLMLHKALSQNHYVKRVMQLWIRITAKKGLCSEQPWKHLQQARTTAKNQSRENSAAILAQAESGKRVPKYTTALNRALALSSYVR